MDVKSAFIYGTIDEEVYVTQPPRFVDPKFPNKVFKVVKVLYGLHQAPKAWYATLSTFLEKSRYRRGAINKALFIKKDKKDIMLVQVYVDDIMFVSTKKSWCDEFEELMKNRFQMSSMGELTFFLRLQVTPKTSHLQAVKRIFSKELASPKQTALGKDESNPLIVDSLLKTIWSSMHHVITMKHWLFQGKQPLFWSMAKVKTINDEVRVQALIDVKRVNINESSIRRAVKLDDEEGTSCLANDEIFTGLANIGYEKISDKLTFYKAFFSPQWMFLIHTILQCLSAKTTSWNEFNSTMASTIICLATSQKFNFSRYILLSLVKNIEARVPFYMFPRFVQLIIDHRLGDMSHHQDIYDNPSFTKKVFANMKRVGTGFSRVITPLFENMLVPAAKEVGQAQDDVSIPIEPSTSKPYKNHKSKKQQPKAPMVYSLESSPEHTIPLPSNDPIPAADKDSLKFQKLIDLCTRLSNKVLDLESKVIDIKSSFTNKIEKLEDRVHKLEEENRILKEKSFKSAKIDTTAPVEDNEESFK
nr:copia protein [Tanacetum cinerariifolium]